jgi:alkylation response protein AidB-like acyl-CoA dehydrogenase
MSNQAAIASVHTSGLPERPSHDPVMRREIATLRAELEEMRAVANEARKTNRLLYAYIDYILENQYQWEREAKRLSSLLKKRPQDQHWLFSWRNCADQNDRPLQPSPRLTP